jgi:hypothetical protein
MIDKATTVTPTYSFAHRWRLQADPEQVYDVLVDVEHYPEWWPEVRAVVSLGEDHALVLCRSRLPLSLWLELRPEVRDREGGELRVSLAGDLEGWSTFTLRRDGDYTDVGYEQRVEVAKPALRLLHPWARPFFRANHGAMMESARTSLTRELAVRSRG